MAGNLVNLDYELFMSVLKAKFALITKKILHRKMRRNNFTPKFTWRNIGKRRVTYSYNKNITKFLSLYSFRKNSSHFLDIYDNEMRESHSQLFAFMYELCTYATNNVDHGVITGGLVLPPRPTPNRAKNNGIIKRNNKVFRRTKLR